MFSSGSSSGSITLVLSSVCSPPGAKKACHQTIGKSFGITGTGSCVPQADVHQKVVFALHGVEFLMFSHFRSSRVYIYFLIDVNSLSMIFVTFLTN